MKWYSSSRLKDGNMDDRCGLMILCASQWMNDTQLGC